MRNIINISKYLGSIFLTAFLTAFLINSLIVHKESNLNLSTGGPGTLLFVPQGGTGTSTLPLGKVLMGNGNRLTTASSTANTVLYSSGGIPSFQTNLSLGVLTLTGTSTMDGFAFCTAGNGACGGVGTVTSVAMTVPTGLSISGSPITGAGTLALTLTSGYNIPLTTSTTDWQTAFTNRITSAYTPLSIAGNQITIATSSASVSGFLTTTDWNTFNNKQATITDGTNLTFTGATLNVDDPFSVTKLTATNASSTNATLTNFWSTNGQITNASTTYLTVGSSAFFPSGIWNSSGNVGIGTTTPGSLLSVHSSGNVYFGGALTVSGATTLQTALGVASGGTGASTLSGFLYGNGTSAVTGTTTPYFASGFFTGADSYVNGNKLDGYFYPAFAYLATSTINGTEIIPLGPAYNAETWSSVKCFTDVGTVNVFFSDGTNDMNTFNASTTVGTVSLTSNNTYTASEKRYVELTSPASSPTRVSCSVRKNF